MTARKRVYGAPSSGKNSSVNKTIRGVGVRVRLRLEAFDAMILVRQQLADIFRDKAYTPSLQRHHSVNTGVSEREERKKYTNKTVQTE